MAFAAAPHTPRGSPSTDVIISVIVPTYRIGGLDVVCDSLARQTHPDFELIIADGIYEHRRDIVATRARDYHFPIKHTCPRDNLFPINSYCHKVNTALSHASGDIALFLSDYAALSPTCLEAHSVWHSLKPTPFGLLMMGVEHRSRPALREGIPAYGPNLYVVRHDHAWDTHERMLNEGMQLYVEDLEAGKLAPFMWSVFEHAPSFNELGDNPLDWHHIMPPGSSPPSNVVLQNESIPLAALEEVNGLDEEFDGSHVYQDADLADRLHARDYRWFSLPDVTMRVANPRTFLYVRKLERHIHSNLARWRDKKTAGFPPVNPGWSLRHARRATLGLDEEALPCAG